MRRSLRPMAGLAAALLLGSATIASASSDLGPSPNTAVVTPADHEGDDDDGGSGRPENPGRPDGVGQPDGVGVAALGHDGAAPELPDQASDRAHEAVGLAFERQVEIQARVAQIRDLPPGQDKGPAVSALMKDFGELFRLTNDAVGDEEV